MGRTAMSLLRHMMFSRLVVSEDGPDAVIAVCEGLCRQVAPVERPFLADALVMLRGDLIDLGHDRLVSRVDRLIQQFEGVPTQ